MEEEKKAKPRATRKAAKEPETIEKKTAAKKETKKAPVKKAPAKKPAAAKKDTKKVQEKPEVKEKNADDQRTSNKEESPAMMEEKKKILFVSTEATPFITTGGMGEVVGALPKAIAAAQPERYDIRIVLPLYSQVKHQFVHELEYLGYTYVALAWRNQYCGIFKKQVGAVTYYFIDNEYYFDRSGCYGQYDDAERFAFYCKAVMEMLDFVDFHPQILHAHDWQSALSIVYLKTKYNWKYGMVKAVFTIHNIEYQGKYSMDLLGDIFDLGPEHRGLMEYEMCINLMKAAIECADVVTTVSPTYAQQLFDDYYAHGLAHIIRNNAWKLKGILNGIDVESYNPETDPSLFVNYGVNTIERKKENKVQLQNMLGMHVEEGVPMIAMITRLAGHKGLDLVGTVIEEILKEHVQMVVLGTGESQYEAMLESVQRRYPGKMVAYIAYNSDVARKLYAAADLFLMPSKSEPCGLSQMIASRYGTPAIVRETGGLKDSIRDCAFGEGNGFTFVNYDAWEMLDTVRRALRLYYERDNFLNLAKEAMRCDFSWNKSAMDYISLYETLN